MYTILIADDEPFERKALRKILTSSIPGIFRIEDSCDGQSAIEKARQILPDIIILDIKMPRVNGLDAAKRIRTFHPDCRIILLSGYTYFNYAKEAVSIGINDFLVKPVSDDELIASVKNLMTFLEEERENRCEGGKRTEKMNNLYSCIEKELITSLPFQQMKEPYLSSYLEALGIDYTYSISLILSGANQEKMIEPEIERLKVMMKSFLSANHVFIQEVGGLVYCIIFLSRFLQKPQVKESLENMTKNISSTLSLDFDVGAGTIKSDPSEIFESFDEARRALSIDHRVNLFERIFQLNKIPLSIEKEELLLDSVINGNIEESLGLLNEVYEIINETCKDFSKFKVRVYEMLIVLSRKLRKEIALEDGLTYHINLDKCLTRTEVKAYLIQVVLESIDKVNDFIATSNNAWKSQIKSYLKKNFTNTITLQDLSDIAGFSTSYLSRMFKKEFGMNCISYINHLRINEAKKLLNASNLSIKEIAYTIGYSDANYFARVFRRETGINASQYKNRTE